MFFPKLPKQEQNNRPVSSKAFALRRNKIEEPVSKKRKLGRLMTFANILLLLIVFFVYRYQMDKQVLPYVNVEIYPFVFKLESKFNTKQKLLSNKISIMNLDLKNKVLAADSASFIVLRLRSKSLNGRTIYEKKIQLKKQLLSSGQTISLSKVALSDNSSENISNQISIEESDLKLLNKKFPLAFQKQKNENSFFGSSSNPIFFMEMYISHDNKNASAKVQISMDLSL